MNSFKIPVLLLSLLAPLALQSAPVPEDNLREVLRYIHRWHFDNMIASELPQDTEEINVLVRELKPELDAGDRSRFAELWFPGLRMRVALKKAHYRIAELDLDLESPRFKVVKVERLPQAPAALASYERVAFRIDDLRDYLRSTLRENEFPGPELITRMREQFLKEIAGFPDLREAAENAPGNEHVFYIAPVSSVSNEIWVYWDNPQIAVGLCADFPLEHLESLDFVASRLHLLRLDRDVEFVPEAGRVLNPVYSKDWVGRMLVNCIVLGRRVTVPREEVKLFQELEHARESSGGLME